MARQASMPPPPEPTLPASAGEMRQALLAWYDRSHRRLPWRPAPGEPADPYAVLLSEIMLQQTTVATVRPRFAAFLARFPDLASLAAAPLDAVLHAWQGLGYYRRARALHALAATVVARHAGRLPSDIAALEALPGLGPYTAGAVAAIAFGRPALPVDGNVARVLCRVAAVETPLPRAMPALRRLAAGLAGGSRPGDLAQAVIELGALLCRPARPDCPACPWSTACLARRHGLTDLLPRRLARTERPVRFATAFLVRRDDGALLLRRRAEDGLLGGMIELPSTPWTGAAAWPLRQALGHAPTGGGWRPLAGEVRHVFTHFALRTVLVEGAASGGGAGLWSLPRDLAELALPTLTRKLLRHGGIAV